MKIKAWLLFFITLLAVSQFAFSQTIASGSGHSLVLCSNGNVQSFGSNQVGELGNGTSNATGNPKDSIPGNVNLLTNVISVTAGYYFSMALKSDATVWAWGHNIQGQLGDGTTVPKSFPVQVNITDVLSIAAGASSFHSLAIKSNGRVYSWGLNSNGQLGRTTMTIANPLPGLVPGLTDVMAIAAGQSHSLALKNDGTVWAWGSNMFGQVGDSTTIDRQTPVQVWGLSGIIAIAAGGVHSLALKSDGTVWAWGINLGNGIAETSIIPVQVCGYIPRGCLLTNVIAIAAGVHNSCAVKNDGTVWIWGDNFYGQICDGTTIGALEPVAINMLSGVMKASIGEGNVLVLKNDGTVWGWGNNYDGQLGDGTYIIRTSPVQVTGLCTVAIGYEELPTTINKFLACPTISSGAFMVEMYDVRNTDYHLEIFNAEGKKVYSENISVPKKEIHLNNPQRGVYLVRATGADKTFMQKIIIN